MQSQGGSCRAHRLAGFGWIEMGLAALCVVVGGLEILASGPLDAADAAFVERTVDERLFEAIALYEQALADDATLTDGERAHALNRLAQLCYEATTLVVGDTPEDRALFERGKASGLNSLRLDPAFGDLEADGFAEAVAAATDVAALLWTANNWGGLLGVDPIQGLLHFGKVKRLYERVLELDEAYWGASAHNALGALLVVTPTPLGGDPKAGRQHLESAIALAPDYLINRVVYAQYWGFTYNLFGGRAGVRDVALIEEQLAFVDAAEIGDWPFWNREAKRETALVRQWLSTFD